jgi:hypothetical protein
MVHPMSALGAFHTALSVVPVFAGFSSFVRHGKIDPTLVSGKVYWIGMIASVLTSFGLSSTGHFNPGHAIGILAIVSMLVGTFAFRIRFFGKAAIYIQTVAMSFSFMLLMIPGTNETLSRLPPDHPIGNGPDSPPVQMALAGMFVVFLLGTAYQIFRLRSNRNTQQETVL